MMTEQEDLATSSAPEDTMAGQSSEDFDDVGVPDDEDVEVPDDEDVEVPEEAAPPVVAVVVTRDPGPWFEESLGSLRDQDYPNLTIIVIDAASAEDPTERVAEVVPKAFFRRLEGDSGFGASANEVAGMAEGATHFVFCHDDVAADPSAVRLMVEEAFRSNAAVVAPKMVAWEDPTRLLSVGMNADKLGALADRLVPGELDQEQHDSVRDVFVAPGGFTLIRADLFANLGGFDPLITMFGEDLDFSWRAQVAGARVVVAPGARVRHIEATRSGTRWRDRAGSSEEIRALARRHELRTLLKCYGAWSLLRVLPQAVAASVAEVLICLVTGKLERARSVVGAWIWNLGRLGSLRQDRRQVQASRHISDRDVREFQVGGFARVSSFTRRLAASYAGVHHLSLHGVEVRREDQGDESAISIGGRWDFGLPDWLSLVWIGIGILLFFGMRHWATAALPSLGQLGHLPSSLTLVHRYLDGGQVPATGAYSPAPPVVALLGISSTVLFGATGFVQKLLFLGALPGGALGVYRLGRSFGGRIPRLLATAAYLVVALPYDLFSAGRLEALVAYGATPWLVSRLFRAWRTEPCEAEGQVGWRGRIAFGILMALVSSVAPGEIVVLGIVLIGTGLGSLVVGGIAGWVRSVGLVVTGTAVAAVLLGPWLPSFLGPWHALVPLVGQGGPAWSAPGLGAFVRFDLGFLGGGIAGWAMLVPAGLAVAVGLGWRFRWAVRMWGVMVVSWLSAWAGAHGWLGGTTMDPSLFLVPGAIAMAVAISLGASAFVTDLSSHRFGWHQAVAAASAMALTIGALPVVAALVSGQFGLPITGWGEMLTAANTGAPGLTLWVGDPRALPSGSWVLGPGVAYAISPDEVPGQTDLWVPVDPRRAARVAAAVERAHAGLTSRLGHDLAALGVTKVVVPLQLAPGSAASRFPPPAWVMSSLQSQGDLSSIPVDPSVEVFSDHDVAITAAGAATRSTKAPSYRWAELAAQLAAWSVAVWWVVLA